MKQTVVSVLAISALTLPSLYILWADMPPSAPGVSPANMLMQTAQPAAPLQVNTAPDTSPANEVPTVVPEAPPEQPAPAPEGPDTISLPEEKIGFRGNWVKKREWLLRAKEVNRKIQDNVTACEQRRTPLLKDYTNMQTYLEAFYQDINRRLGKLQSESLSLTEKTETANAQAAHLSVQQERKIEHSIPTFEEFDERTEFQKKAQSFPEEVSPIKNLDEALTKRIEKLDEELDSIRSDAERAQVLYEEMWEVLDDQKAQTYFYQLKDIAARIKTIRDYIENDFTNDFASLITKTREQVESIKEKMLDLEATYKALQKAEQEKENARLARQQNQTSQSWYIAYPKKVFSGVTSFFSSVFDAIKGLFVKKVPLQPVRSPKVEQPAPQVTPAAH